ncbi:hypothetical protein ACHAXT_000931 [Thalassiosira profunda]
MLASLAARSAARAAARRPMSTAAAPKMHKAKDAWGKLPRPPPGHDHAVFEPPYNPIVVTCGVIGVVCTGYGMMYFGMRHQQYKQGYWK